ncbi:hypothetical protein BDY21DRAFT_352485 [Lineolata rhizophorae]|uniref:Uncharacterized protein n=1 Tax=Lineolata rhizophorae TaxID=578093 RepID=A0A6A6NSK9_9PEZI|nr:hypothetical protein BDY21DRAFT_352485 [Lineolata rhizophorae]
MRIPIREQLGALVLISSLIGLAVISIAIWVRFDDAARFESHRIACAPHQCTRTAQSTNWIFL